jgi:hypothetical protein
MGHKMRETEFEDGTTQRRMIRRLPRTWTLRYQTAWENAQAMMRLVEERQGRPCWYRDPVSGYDVLVWAPASLAVTPGWNAAHTLKVASFEVTLKEVM